MQQIPVISIVSPVFNGELLIQLLVDRLTFVLTPLTEHFEIILVDDGSDDDSVAVLKNLSRFNQHLKVINLSKNHGQHIAIKAGLDSCKGDWIVVMDCDLQDEPEAIGQLFMKAKNGYDAVFANRKKKYDAWYKKMYSTIFYGVLGFITFKNFSGSTANFGIYSRPVINKVVADSYNYFFFPLAVRNHVKSYSTIDVAHATRAAGETGYTFLKAFNLAFKIIISNTISPLFNKKVKVHYSLKETINLNDSF